MDRRRRRARHRLEALAFRQPLQQATATGQPDVVLRPAFHIQVELALLQAALAVFQLAAQATVEVTLLQACRQHQP